MYKNARIIAIYPTNFRVFRPGKDFEVICNLATTITYVIIYVRGDTYNFRNQLTYFVLYVKMGVQITRSSDEWVK